jgi:hypothetical protein
MPQGSVEGVVMINRWVARVYGTFLTFMHIVVIIALIMLVIAYLVHQQQFAASTGRPEVVFDPAAVVFVSKLNEFFARHIFLVYVAATFIGYVIFVGSLATLVAINQNLERISRAMEEASDVGRNSWHSERPLR